MTKTSQAIPASRSVSQGPLLQRPLLFPTKVAATRVHGTAARRTSRLARILSLVRVRLEAMVALGNLLLPSRAVPHPLPRRGINPAMRRGDLARLVVPVLVKSGLIGTKFRFSKSWNVELFALSPRYLLSFFRPLDLDLGLRLSSPSSFLPPPSSSLQHHAHLLHVCTLLNFTSFSSLFFTPSILSLF